MVTRTRVILIRHAESNAQVAGLVAGHATCTGLSDRGVTQSHALSERICAELAEASVVHTSRLRRAQQTARVVAEACGSPAVRASCDWCEIHPGAADGLTWAEMRTRFPAAGDPDDPIARRLPQMETWAEMFQRVGSALETAVRELAGGTVIVVTSGGPVGASFVAFAHASYEAGIARARETRNASLTEWRGSRGSWTLVRHSDAAHLD